MSGSLKEHPKVMALVAVSAVVLVAGLAYTGWTSERRRPNVEHASEPMQLPDREQRREMMQNSGQSRDAMREMFRQMMVDRAKQFALADQATRAQMIIEDRARMEQMGGRRGPGDTRNQNGTRGDGERGDRPEPTDEQKQERREKHESRIEQWVNEGNGQEWALIREYRDQLRPSK